MIIPSLLVLSSNEGIKTYLFVFFKYFINHQRKYTNWYIKHTGIIGINVKPKPYKVITSLSASKPYIVRTYTPVTVIMSYPTNA